METAQHHPPQDRFDQAISKRLRALRSMPLDLTRLKKSIEAQIPRPKEKVSTFGLNWINFRAVAATLLICGLVGAFVAYGLSRPTLASPARLANIHDQVLCGEGKPIANVDAANAFFANKWSGAPVVPRVAKEQVETCCICRIGNKKVACICLSCDGQMIAMATAKDQDIYLPEGKTTQVGGVTWRTVSHGQTTMIMTERDGRWVCLMGKVPADRLVELAGTLQF